MNTVLLKTSTIFEKKEEVLFKNKTFTFLYLASLMLFVTGISYFSLFSQSLRLDEAQSLWQSSHAIKRVVNIIGQDVHVPLYAIMLHFWELFFGDGVATARILSLIFFLLSIPTSYFVAKAAYDRSVGLFTATLVAMSPFMNWYGNEIRMYSLFSFFTLLNQYFFIRIFKPSPTHNTALIWTGYAVTALFGIYIHYFFWLVLATQAIFYFSHTSLFAKGSFKNFIATFFVLLISFTPWVWYIKNLGLASNTQPMLVKPTAINIFNTFSQFLFGFQDDHTNTLLVSLWPLLVLFGFFTMRKNTKLSPETVYISMATVVPIVLALTISFLYKPVFLSRYLILAAPSLYILIAWFADMFSKRLSFSLKTLFVTLTIFTLFLQTSRADTPVKENYHDASIYISQHASSSDIVALSAPFTIYPFEYYYTGQAAVTTLPVWNRFEVGAIPPFTQSKLESEVKTLTQSHQKIWLLLSYNQGYEKQIYQYFETHFQRLEKKEFSPGLTLYSYKLRYD